MENETIIIYWEKDFFVPNSISS